MSQQLDYYPEQRPGVSDEDYRYGIKILTETYKRLNENGGNYNYADYWNIGIASILLQEDVSVAKEMLNKSKSANTENFSKIFLHGENLEETSKWKKVLSESEYKQFLKEAQEALPDPSQRIQPGPKKSIIFSDDYNHSLMSTFRSLEQDDQRYRSADKVDFEKQLELDQRNIEIIDMLYNVHRTYIGKSYVGKRYKEVMWQVVMHSHLNAMEKYLPAIHAAARSGEIKADRLHQLLDRIYTLKYAYQIYGTQAGVPIGPAKEMDELRKKYNIDFAANTTYPLGLKEDSIAAAKSFPEGLDKTADPEKSRSWLASIKRNEN